MEEKNYTIALLIDTENVSAKYLDVLIKELIALGRVTYKRMYGDFTAAQTTGWKSIVNQFSIMPVQQYTYTTGKNVTDSKMIIDAMDILYTGNVDAFCIMSSDSDFTGLAKRLKESNMFVIGAGESKTPGSFINACDRFFKLDNLVKGKRISSPVKEKEEKEPAKKKAKAAENPAVPSASVAAKKKTVSKARGTLIPATSLPAHEHEHEREHEHESAVVVSEHEREREPERVDLPKEEEKGREDDYTIPREEIEDFVVSLFESSDKTEIQLSIIVSKIFQAYPDFNPKDYGVSKARKFFEGGKFIQKTKGTDVLISLKDDI